MKGVSCPHPQAVCATPTGTMAMLCDRGAEAKPGRYEVLYWDRARRPRAHDHVSYHYNLGAGLGRLGSLCDSLGGEVATLGDDGRLPTPWWGADRAATHPRTHRRLGRGRVHTLSGLFGLRGVRGSRGALGLAQDNPWAICTAAVGREDKTRYERCVMGIKKRLGME